MTGPTRLVLRGGGATDTGQLRQVNQDSYVILSDLGLYLVADGMGGAQGGEVASQLVVEAVRETYRDPSADALLDTIAEANRRIHEASESPSLRGMGTTAVALALLPEEPDPDAGSLGDGDDGTAQHLLILNVGDSRAYLLRDGGLTQLTEDHSMVADLLRDGHITAEEAEVHPQRNIITRVLGVYPEVTPDLWPVDPVRGDRYLLCSDGLFNEVRDDQITAALRRLHDPAEAASELVRLANEGGGRDNITVIVVDVIDDGGVAAQASKALTGTSAGSARPTDDIAGFSTARPSETPEAPSGRRQRRAARRATKQVRSRLTWRVLLFALLLAAVLGGSFATIQWYGTSTYYVGFDGDEVTIYQGRPGGVLWIDPKVTEGTGIERDQVPAPYLDAVEAGHEQTSLADARRYVRNIERDISETATDTTTSTPDASTSTTAGTSTTTVAAN
ncbi:MAG: PP2C family serine/threonine-protein phosphatase [Acidimicrobiales bacterium]